MAGQIIEDSNKLELSTCGSLLQSLMEILSLFGLAETLILSTLENSKADFKYFI